MRRILSFKYKKVKEIPNSAFANCFRNEQKELFISGL